MNLESRSATTTFLETGGRGLLAFALATLAAHAYDYAVDPATTSGGVRFVDIVGVGGFSLIAARIAGPALVRSACHLAGFWIYGQFAGASWSVAGEAGLFFAAAVVFLASLVVDFLDGTGDSELATAGRPRDRRQFGVGSLLAAIFLVSAYFGIGRWFWQQAGPAAIEPACLAILVYAVPRSIVGMASRTFGPLNGTIAAYVLLAPGAIAVAYFGEGLPLAFAAALFVGLREIDRRAPFAEPAAFAPVGADAGALRTE